MTSHLLTSFKQACHLCKVVISDRDELSSDRNTAVIITDIMDKIYPVQPSSETPRRVSFEQLETRLNKWQIDLPEPLRYSQSDRRNHILPHVLLLHIEYHAAVLLLHRAL